jgi:chemotaxis response regulator CheB
MKKQSTLKMVDKECVPISPKAVRLESEPFPIVGIGASAGGLEALELFL